MWVLKLKSVWKFHGGEGDWLLVIRGTTEHGTAE